MLNLLLGRTNGLFSELLALLARLLGLLNAALLEAGRSWVLAPATPNDRRLPPRSAMFSGGGTAPSSPVLLDAAEILLGRFRLLRTVTDEGMPPSSPRVRGEFLVGVGTFEGGNLERTDCTRSSIFCIRPIRPLI